MGESDKPETRRVGAIPPSVLARLTVTEKPPKPQTLLGVVREGVERGAVVLLDDRGGLLAQLMGGDPAVLADGSRVEVAGVFRRDLSTTAQQGPPFQVWSAKAAADGDG
jgi:hypothetical protein